MRPAAVIPLVSVRTHRAAIRDVAKTINPKKVFLISGYHPQFFGKVINISKARL